MIRVRFMTADGLLTGFSLSGHAGMGEHGQDIVCASVSSAALMTANTITEIIGATADVATGDGHLSVTVTSRIQNCQDVLSGFRLHIQAHAEEYPKAVQLMISEV